MRRLAVLIFPFTILFLFALAIRFIARFFGAALALDNYWMMYLLFGGTLLFTFVSIPTQINAMTRRGSSIFKVAGVLLGFLMYLLQSCLVFELLTYWVPMSAVAKAGFALTTAILLSLYGIWNAWHLRIKEQNIRLAGLTKPIRAIHLTDTHLGHYRGAEEMIKIVKRINEIPDLDVVFFTGDLFDSTIQLKKECMDPLKALKVPVYFVAGNHDIYTGLQAINDYLREIGVRVLENEVALWGELQIVGLRYMMSHQGENNPHVRPGMPTIKSVLPQLPIDENKVSILLHHGPAGIRFANEAGIDLYLAGHTHGGQLFPANLIARLLFEHTVGLKDFNGTQVYVCSGSGTFGPPMRIGTNSQMTLLTLSPA